MASKQTLESVGRARRVLGRASASEKVARVRFEAAMIRAVGEGASQREIALAASVSQPFVSQVLAKRAGRFVPRSRLGYLLASRSDELIAAAGRRDVVDLAVFGSVARGEDGPNSDIDLMATIPPDVGLLGLAKLEVEFARILSADVDLVPDDLLTATVRATAERDRALL